MVDRDRLEQWVRQKLDEGVSEDRIRESLRETGHDPSIVEEAKDPFKGDDTEISGEDFSFTAEENAPSIEHRGEETASPAEEEETGSEGEEGLRSFDGREEELDSGIGAGSLDEDEGLETGGVKAGSKDEEEGSGFSIPSLSVPELPLWPILIILLAAGGFSAYTFVPWSSLGTPQVPAVEAPDVSLPGSGSSTSASGRAKCPDVGVRIESISSGGGKTRAEVLVTRGSAEVVLEIWQGASLAGSSTAVIAGPGSMTVDATGDRAVFHPVGCREFSDAVAIG